MLAGFLMSRGLHLRAMGQKEIRRRPTTTNKVPKKPQIHPTDNGLLKKSLKSALKHHYQAE